MYSSHWRRRSSKLNMAGPPALRATRALIRRVDSSGGIETGTAMDGLFSGDQAFGFAGADDDFSGVFQPADGIDDPLLRRFDVADADGTEVLDFFLQHGGRPLRKVAHD